MEQKKTRGFASMTPEQRSEIARKGGLAVSQNKAYMSEIGKKGGNQTKQKRNKT